MEALPAHFSGRKFPNSFRQASRRNPVQTRDGNPGQDIGDAMPAVESALETCGAHAETHALHRILDILGPDVRLGRLAVLDRRSRMRALKRGNSGVVSVEYGCAALRERFY